ncbi:MAG TPA: NAD(P)/FAD-dependent oxidoreductase [Bryobacteraceae bacterium]|nr:NAD(P)/FAD-dependent oxidoreductase [Bryobacteraceae bacterium]
MQSQRAVIIGAGPAGLTAAYELLSRTSIRPVVLEKSDYLGGICRTAIYKGNRIDIGGHRFFSKSDRVMKWWLQMLPLQSPPTEADSDPADQDRVMLLRPRKSRCYYLGQFFDYPISLSADTLAKLGVRRACRIGGSYLRSALFPIRREETLEHFLINRFGAELYRTFFRSYTEKVWGVPCDRISAEWGVQRIKGLSVGTAVRHALKRTLRGGDGSLSQRDTQTSLIERFLYPKFGPGQMWEEVARRIREMGGQILTGYAASRLTTDGWSVRSVQAIHKASGRRESFEADYVFSTAPIQELLRALDAPPPSNVLEVSDGLVYRDFITVGVLVRSLKISDATDGGRTPIRDNWIYVQDPGVRLGRVQVFNNWSPDLVADPSQIWLGLEYFCSASDGIWNLPDDEMVALAQEELVKIGLIDRGEVIDSTVLRVEKAYPAYFGSFHRFGEIRDHIDQYSNLYLIGRNGMHRYNNQDHSMLTAMMAVDGILAGETDKARLWQVNTEADYLEGAT